MLRQIIAGAKAIGSNDIPFPTYPAGLWTIDTPRRRLSTRNVDPLSNSAVSAVVESMSTAFMEPTIREFERVDGEWGEVPDSGIAGLVAEPNPFMEGSLISAYAAVAQTLNGSGFLYKVRNFTGETIQMWPLYPDFVKPHTPERGDEFMDYWKYRVPGKEEVRLRLDDVIHLRWKLDGNDMRVGRSLIKPLLLEVLTDEEAAQYTAAILHNMGVPGVVISPRNPDDPEIGNPERTAKLFRRKTSGDRRGDPFVASKAIRVDRIAFTPDEMVLEKVRSIPEERIAAAIGWPAILSGLGAGLHATSGRGESSTLREDAVESTLVPRWNVNGQQWTRQLLRDWNPDQNAALKYDLADVRALSEDVNDAAKRANEAVTAGVMTVAEARRVYNLPIEDQHQIFLRSVSQTAVNVDEDATGEGDEPGE